MLETTVIIVIISMTRTTSDTIETREWYIKGIGGDGRCGCVCSSDCGTLLLWMSGHTTTSTTGSTNTSGGRTSIDRPWNHHGIHHQTTWSTTTTSTTSTIVVMMAAGDDDGSS